MYSSSTSSSSQGNSLGPSNGSGLVRYGSAPSSLLSTAVDSIMNPDGGEFSGYGLHMGPSSHAPPSTSRLFFSSSETSPQQHAAPKTSDHVNNGGLQRAYGFAGSSAPPPPPLVRQRSSPAGFLNQLAHAACTSNDENGFSTARAHGVSRLNSQMSFTRQDALSLISEESEDEANEKRKSAQSYNAGSYGGGGTSWEDPHTIMFSMGPSKRPKDISTGLDGMESQIQFGMPETMLEMASMDKLLNIPEDSVPCKIRAKRGCATHPRSIAERERRTRISGKLKKLHDLVPNMDKQTSYADMLDLAVQHIKGLQDHVQKLNSELDNCTCGCRRPNNDSGEERR